VARRQTGADHISIRRLDDHDPRPSPYALFLCCDGGRTKRGALFTVLVRYLGEAGFTHAALSFLIGIVGWLYILGECFFGQMNEIVSRSEDEVLQRGYFWLRLILTIGWAIYPLSDFITNFAGGVDSGGRDLAFNLADFVNRIGFGLTILAVAMNAAEARTQTIGR
jgi:sensory rhodopsin